MNSYSYGRDNPITLSDPSGKWFQEFLTGKQSWTDFSSEVGDATQYMGSTWQQAMDHPIATGMLVVGPSSVVIASSGIAAGTALYVAGSSALAGAGVSYVAGQATAGIVYTGLAASTAKSIPSSINMISKVNTAQPSSYAKAGASLIYNVGPSFARESVGAMADAIQIGKIMSNTVINLANKAQSLLKRSSK